MSSIKDQLCATWNQIREKSGFNPFILIGAVVGVIFSLLYLGKLEKEIVIVTGIVYPVYMSMKALDTKDQEDDKQWCTYWVVFFTFELVELYVETLGFGVLHKIVPYYFLIKLVFLIWLFFPSTMGANFVYEKILSNFFSKYEAVIDSKFNEVKSSISAKSAKN
jgi:receptor expression-enhancing protein 5/6